MHAYNPHGHMGLEMIMRKFEDSFGSFAWTKLVEPHKVVDLATCSLLTLETPNFLF